MCCAWSSCKNCISHTVCIHVQSKSSVWCTRDIDPKNCACSCCWCNDTSGRSTSMREITTCQPCDCFGECVGIAEVSAYRGCRGYYYRRHLWRNHFDIVIHFCFFECSGYFFLWELAVIHTKHSNVALGIPGVSWVAIIHQYEVTVWIEKPSAGD